MGRGKRKRRAKPIQLRNLDGELQVDHVERQRAWEHVESLSKKQRREKAPQDPDDMNPFQPRLHCMMVCKQLADMDKELQAAKKELQALQARKKELQELQARTTKHTTPSQAKEDAKTTTWSKFITAHGEATEVMEEQEWC